MGATDPGSSPDPRRIHPRAGLTVVRPDPFDGIPADPKEQDPEDDGGIDAMVAAAAATVFRQI